MKKLLRKRTYESVIVRLISWMLALGLPGIALGSDSPASPQSNLIRSTAAFEFHNDPWIQLHHFLFEWARSEAKPTAGDRRPAVDVTEKTFALPATEVAIWEKSLAFYRRHLVAKNLTFDPDLAELKSFLINSHSLPNELEKAPPRLRPWLEALTAAMPVYQAHWWHGHQAASSKFLSMLIPLAESYESFFLPRLQSAYGGSWPRSRIRVDASVYAGTYGGYTTNQPDNIVLGSIDPVKEGLGGLDTLFHEASHAESFEVPLQTQVAQAFESVGAEVPRDLVHVIQFFTPSFLLQMKLGQAAKEYTPLAARLGLYDRIPHWSTYRDLLQRFWVPFLRGEVDRRSALKNLAENLAHPESDSSQSPSAITRDGAIP